MNAVDVSTSAVGLRAFKHQVQHKWGLGQTWHYLLCPHESSQDIPDQAKCSLPCGTEQNLKVDLKEKQYLRFKS